MLQNNDGFEIIQQVMKVI